MDFETRRLRARLQIPLLCYVRMMEPLAFYTIFPYIAQMTKHNDDIPDTDVGFYKGFFESLFYVVYPGVLIFWGSLADRVGYKFILLCTPERQSRTFGWYTFADMIAYFAGPLLGSVLADPVSQYTAVFKGVPLFEHFPCALPGMVPSSVPVTVLFIDDSRKVSKEEPDTASGERENSQGHHRPSIGKLIKAPGVIGVLCTLSHVRLLGSSMMAISTTALYTPVRLGGTGYSLCQIATLIAAQGACEAIWLLSCVPFYTVGSTQRHFVLVRYHIPLGLRRLRVLNELIGNGSEVARA
ncbi:MAG: hypothetical protein Q9177_003773 [Variospora cf. flavescens]